MATLFTKIIKGEIPSFKIREDERFYAFLDIAPQKEGHTLVIPKVEVDKFFDMDECYLSNILLFAKPIALAIEQAFDCNRCGIITIGLEVPHAHLHLLPINEMKDMSFNAAKRGTPAQLEQAQQKILAHLKV